jgi:hypothetical protein
MSDAKKRIAERMCKNKQHIGHQDPTKTKVHTATGHCVPCCEEITDFGMGVADKADQEHERDLRARKKG